MGPEAYITVTVVLKLLGRDSVIMSTGPIDLAQKFGYKLVMEPESPARPGGGHGAAPAVHLWPKG